ncbi:MAG: exosortase F system-associated protein [Mesonia sp.]|uniref:exosortase F system-associated membrane protein n=1 Tax=Mesonia sp. TaxID=1960830 RepID=UPI00324296AF
MNKFLKYGLAFLGFVLLAAIRTFETEIFYDPLLNFFRGNYHNYAAPDFELWKLFGATIARYLLNSLVSILILVLLFSKQVLKFSVLIYGSLLLLLAPIFLYLLTTMQPDLHFLLFYVRRFLIQPLLILLLIPAFYYQQHIKKADS